MERIIRRARALLLPRFPVWAALALTGMLVLPVHAEQDDATELEPMVVTPPYRHDTDRQLDRVSRQLPDPGQGGTVHKGFWQQLIEYDPNELHPYEQEQLLHSLEKLGLE